MSSAVRLVRTDAPAGRPTAHTRHPALQDHPASTGALRWAVVPGAGHWECAAGLPAPAPSLAVCQLPEPSASDMHLSCAPLT